MTDNNDKIINLEKQKKHLESSALGGLLPQIFKTFTQELKPKLITCFEALDDSLFDLAEKAESNQDQTLYFESMRMIRKSRNQIYSDFFNGIQSTFKSFKNNKFDYFKNSTHNKTSTQSDTNLKLSLIDEKELDETLAQSNLIHKSEMAFHKELFAIEKRFSLLASGTELKSDQIPIGPHVLVHSFSNSIKKLDIPVNLKLIVYKLFERNVMGQMNPIYSSINEILSKNGIISELKYNVGRTSQSHSQSHKQNNINKQQTETIEHDNQRNTQQSSDSINNNQSYSNANSQSNDPNYQLISQLFKQQGQQDLQEFSDNQNNNPNTVTNNSIQTPVNIDMSSMMNALSILQSDVFTNTQVAQTENKSPIEIKDELLKQLHKIDTDSEGKVVRQQDEDTIDLVGMLFQFIVEDRNLPDAIQVILAKLQIPYLKVALQDRNIFADKNHPARTLLDSLSMASVGWSKETDTKSRFITKIEDTVHEILENDELTKELFVTWYESFNQFLKKSQKKAEVIEKRTNEKSLGQDKIDLAKKESAQLLVDKMTDKQLPSVIRDILLGEWSNVLILMHLRYSKDSKEFINKVKFIDRLIQTAQQDKKTDIQQSDIKELVCFYEEGLRLVAFNPKEIMDKQHQLLKCLEGIHNLSDNAVEDVEMIAPEDVLKLSKVKAKENVIVEYIEEIIEPSNELNEDEDDDELLKIVDKLKIGTWLEFNDVDKGNVRAKLSWISPITGNYLFVNSKGLKISNKNKFDLATGLRDKSIRMLQQVALFDRALSSIASNMKNQNPEDSNKSSVTS